MHGTRMKPSPAFGRNQTYFVSFVVFVVPLCSFNKNERNHERDERHENITQKSSSCLLIEAVRPRFAPKGIKELPGPAGGNVALAAQAVFLGPAPGHIVGPEQPVPQRRMDRKVLVDRLRFRRVMP